MNIKTALDFARIQLADSDSPRLDSEILLAFTLQKPRIFLITDPEYKLTPAQEQQFQALIMQRVQSYPIAYLVGQQEFWSLSFKVTPQVLIPRPETELCVQAALDRVHFESACIADIGTGSGCIAIALACERPHWQIIATDLSPEALKIAQINATLNHAKNIEFRVQDALVGFEPSSLDAVISNPPYIGPQDPHLESAVKQYEPTMALIAEQEGYALLFKIAEQALHTLKPKGWLILEHGHRQAESLRSYLKNLGYVHVESRPDLQGIDRITCAERP